MIKVSGTVVEGNKKGREFGFPTANIKLAEKIDSGVYRGRVKIDNQEYKAAVFVWSDKPILEAYIIDFGGDLYGREIEVELVAKLRDVIKFENETELIDQIKKDVKLISEKFLKK